MLFEHEKLAKTFEVTSISSTTSTLRVVCCHLYSRLFIVSVVWGEKQVISIFSRRIWNEWRAICVFRIICVLSAWQQLTMTAIIKVILKTLTGCLVALQLNITFPSPLIYGKLPLSSAYFILRPRRYLLQLLSLIIATSTA